MYALHVTLSLLRSSHLSSPVQIYSAECLPQNEQTIGLTVRQSSGRDYCVFSAWSYSYYIISRLAMNLKCSIIHIPLFTCAVFTALELPPGNLALLPVAAEASFVYIVWLIACKEHNELLMSCASDPAAAVCTVNVIRDADSCPWWACNATVFMYVHAQGRMILYASRSGRAGERFLLGSDYFIIRTQTLAKLQFMNIALAFPFFFASRQFVHAGKLLIGY